MRCHYLICLVVLAMIGCSDESPSSSLQPASPRSTAAKDETVKGTGVVDHISYSHMDGLPHINVWPIKSTPLAALADLRLFADFRPGLTFSDVADREGPPSEIRELKNLTELRCYARGEVTLAIGKERLGSYHPKIREKWIVFAFPNEAPVKLNTIAKQAILDQLRIPEPPYCLVLRESTELDGSLWLTVYSNGVAEARWINGESTKPQEK